MHNLAQDTASPELSEYLQEASRTVEAVIFASLAPVNVALLQQAFDIPVSPEFILQCINIVKHNYHNSALMLVESSQGFYFQVKSMHAPVVARLWPERPVKLSQALLETLSVIAYKQPVTRADIEYYRGVAVNSMILRQLFDRGWIIESGFREAPGRPALIITTPEFLKAFHLKSLSDLPALIVQNTALPESDNSLLDDAVHVRLPS